MLLRYEKRRNEAGEGKVREAQWKRRKERKEKWKK